MRVTLIILIFSTVIISALSQDRILYDLDSYKRVDISLRTTFFSPDFSFFYNNTINNPSQVKNYSIDVGGRYTNNLLINSEKNQITKYHDLRLFIESGTNKIADLDYFYQFENRTYNDAKYFMSGFNIQSNMSYKEDLSLRASYIQLLNVSYEIGFGFGRLELINDAWIGARILEELDSKELLNTIPTGDEMKLFFDLIGDVEYERVMDFRLGSMYRIEKIIEFVEQKQWIDKGSIKAFVTIYDAFRYEKFFNRMSGERLEFTIKPWLRGKYNWSNNAIFGESKYIEPGFEGYIEYQIHNNGDLEYYQTKTLGGRINHFQLFQKGQVEDFKSISGDLYFQYQYSYIPSLRTNLLFDTSFFGGFVYSSSYEARISINSSLTYNYYFSPSTQLVIKGGVLYNDNRFQVGDYQPSITGLLSFDIMHAIR